MSDTFTGQIMMFSGPFAPKAFAFCNGQLLAVSQNTQLFLILGTTFGGDGTTTFALPNLMGRAAVSAGQGPGPTFYELGGTYGDPTWTLKPEEMAPHTHQFVALKGPGTTVAAAGNVLATPQAGTKDSGGQANIYSSNLKEAATPLQESSLSNVGRNQAHDNMQPYLPIAMCMCLAGIFPDRN